MGETNSYNVIVSNEARMMLRQHAAFLGNVSERAAKKFIGEFAKAARSLRSFPERGARFNQPFVPFMKYRQLIFDKRYMLIYQIEQQTVFIDYVVDTRQDYQWLLV